MNYFQVPIFIISFNRLSHLRQLVNWLERAGYQNIHIVDNKSTYPPLLSYLAKCPHQVHRMDRNYGHLVLWDSGKFDELINNGNFVLSDCDVVPAETCPANVLERLATILGRYPNFTKVGLSLKIDDLPEHYGPKDKVLAWEAPFWENPLEAGEIYEAAVDTTFAYYRPGIPPSDTRWWRSLRTAPPLTARHLSWYSDTEVPSEEDLYYQSQVKHMSSQWSVTDPLILKDQNMKLQAEIHELRREIALLREPVRWRYYRAGRQALVRVVDWARLGKVLRRLRRHLVR